MLEQHYITTPIYYVNDKPHIGHAYTTIAADVVARHYRKVFGKKSVKFLTGTDEHGTKIAQEAQKQKKDTQEFVDELSQAFETAWRQLAISHDNFIRTTSVEHKMRVTKILNILKHGKTPLGREILYEGTYKGLYCIGCERFLTDKDITDGLCPLHKTKPEKLEEKNWFFRLSDYLDNIQQKIESGELSIHPKERKNETLGLIKQGLDDFSISRSTVTWGIDLPWDSSQKIYVWVDALSNYITNLGFPDDDKTVTQWWKHAAVTQLMAMDILKFHALYWPALLLALDLPLPDNLHVHGFFTIDGEKMSKSTGNVVSPDDLVDEYGSDATRYLILSQFSFGFESDIKVEDFTTKFNADLANGLGNLVSRVMAMTVKYFHGKLGMSLIEDATFQKEIADYISYLKFRDALLVIWDRVAKANKLIDSSKPWQLAETDIAKLRTVLLELVVDIYNIGIALEPFMPTTSQQILDTVTAKVLVKPDNLFSKLHKGI